MAIKSKTPVAGFSPKDAPALAAFGEESLEETRPSTATHDYWITAERKFGSYPGATERCGKWIVFPPADDIDAAWQKVKIAVETGKLGSIARVATAKESAKARNPAVRAICVHTYDIDDVADVRRIRQTLRELGFTKKIPYRTDADTFGDRYTESGKKRVSTYFE